ncbi:hypothetical protein B0H14DRAFT_3672188 [Mycena olivaceomarginata]|nr:hypothetical protein B0H14DRAFT_3672188 [Mycena olivaceomarginata]
MSDFWKKAQRGFSEVAMVGNLGFEGAEVTIAVTVWVDAKLKRDKKQEWGTITGVGKTKRELTDPPRRPPFTYLRTQPSAGTAASTRNKCVGPENSHDIWLTRLPSRLGQHQLTTCIAFGRPVIGPRRPLLSSWWAAPSRHSDRPRETTPADPRATPYLPSPSIIPLAPPATPSVLLPLDRVRGLGFYRSALTLSPYRSVRPLVSLGRPYPYTPPNENSGSLVEAQGENDVPLKGWRTEVEF